MKLTCHNCTTEIDKEDKFYRNCGQGTKRYERPFLPFALESFHVLVDIDGRLWLTLKTLFTKPGVASFEFSQGKRFKYSPPLRLYLVVSLLFFLLFSSFQHLFVSEVNYSSSSIDSYSKAMFVLLPIFALIVSLFFRRSYYLSNLVFSMHIHSVAYFALAIIGPLEKLEQQHLIFLALQSIPALYLVWYFFAAFKTMYCPHQSSHIIHLSKGCHMFWFWYRHHPSDCITGV